MLGPWLIVLGLLWTGWIRLPLPALGFKAKRAGSTWGAFALGVPFAVAICPSCTPALVVLLGAAAASGSPLFGAAMLTSFAVGRAIPLALAALAMEWIEQMKPLARFRRTFELTGSLLLILAGLYLHRYSLARLVGTRNEDRSLATSAQHDQLAVPVHLGRHADLLCAAHRVRLTRSGRHRHGDHQRCALPGRADRWNRRMHGLSVALWVIGFFAAYLALPIRIWLAACRN